MHLKIISIAICFLWLHICKGQDCVYENYYKLCGAAQSAWSSDEPESASSYYKSAFKTVEFRLGSDLHKALIIAHRVRDTTWAYEIAEQLAKGGVPFEYFENFKHYSWYSHFENEFSILANYYQDHFDHLARKKFLDLCLMDSIFNSTYHNFHEGKIEISLAELIDGATEILDSLKYLIHFYGFPCEQNMGYYFNNSEIKLYPITTLLIHIYQRGDLFYKDRLSNISCDGKLRPVDTFGVSKFRGYGDSTGIEQEMTIRYEKVRRNE